MWRRPALITAAVAVAAGAWGWRNVFLWDDVLLLSRSDLYTNPARWVESVTVPLGYETFYWRPAATTSFLLETLVHGGAAWAFRLTSTLLHAATAVLVLTLVGRIVRSRGVALVAALVFAVHPVNVEAALWPSGRFDLFLALFSLAALASLPKSGAGPARWAAPAALAALAFASKETAILLPLVGLLWCEAAGIAERPRWRPAAWLAAGVAAAAFLRFEAISFLFRTRDASVAEAGDAMQRVLLMGRAFATSVETLLFPWGTVGPAHHGERPIPPGDVLGWTGVALAAGVIVLTVVALRRRSPAGWLLLLFLVTYAPASQLVPLDLGGGLHSADRYLYLPMVFAIGAAAVVVDRWRVARPALGRAGMAASALLVAALAAGRIATIRFWNDPVLFWQRAVAMAPTSPEMHGALARAQMEAGDFAGAEASARRAGASGVPVLVEVLVKLDRFADARGALSAAIDAAPQDAGLRIQRGEVAMMLGMLGPAREDFETALAIEEARTELRFQPMLARALADTAELLAHDGEVSSARSRAERAEAVADPRDAPAWVRITRAWIRLRDAPRAAAALRRAADHGAARRDVDALGAQVEQIAR